MHVLDVAAGAGDQTLRVAKRVGPNGRVLATDIADEALRFAALEAQAQGIGNIEFRAMPCEKLASAEASFDAVVCRNGLQYLSDLPKGLAEIHRVLRPQGRFGAVVWAAPERNKFLSHSFSIAYRKLNMPAPGRDEPGPFKLGYGDSFQSALEDARFREVQVAAVKAPAVFASAGDALEFQQQAIGILTQLLEDLPAAERADLWREVEAALRAFERDGSFFADGELLVGSGTK